MAATTHRRIDRRRVKELTEREEEWTLSVTHTDQSVDRYVAVFEEMARDLTA